MTASGRFEEVGAEGSAGRGRDQGPPGAGLLRWVPAVLITAVMAAGLALCTLLPLPLGDPDEGLLRMDWRLRGEESGPCLRPLEEEQAAAPAHMRNPDACLGALPPYRLVVTVDGEVRVDERVRGGGARQDRPLTVYRELALTPGRRVVEGSFFREDGEAGAVELQVRDTVEVDAGRILLLVRRQDTGALEIRPPVR
jgi:hypothetical protein